LFLGAAAAIGLSERGLRGAGEITPTLALHFPAAIIRSPMWTRDPANRAGISLVDAA
jgi:hypothetical protein